MKRRKDNTTGGWKAYAKGKLTEVCVEGEEDAFFCSGFVQKVFVISTGAGRLDPDDIVPFVAKCIDGVPRNVLVRKQTHYAFGSDVRG